MINGKIDNSQATAFPLQWMAKLFVVWHLVSTCWVFFFVQEYNRTALALSLLWLYTSSPAGERQAQRNRGTLRTYVVKYWQSVSPAEVRSGSRCRVVSTQKLTIPPVGLISPRSHWALELQSRAGGRVQPGGQQVTAVLRKDLCEKYWFCFDFSSGFSMLKASNRKPNFWVALLYIFIIVYCVHLRGICHGEEY